MAQGKKKTNRFHYKGKKGVSTLGIFSEYINKKMGPKELEAELTRLIKEYNKQRGCFLLIYYTAIGKQIPDAQMIQADYYIIHDLINGKKFDKMDVFLQTPGGSGETAEEIVKILRKKSPYVSFVIAGEAKSAGTILAMSGNEILMTETGSLGPIDAQVRLGRSVQSAFDYVEWVEEQRRNAVANKSLNPFDATMVAQITPGELNGVMHSLKFAEDLVVDWLSKYKFQNWTITNTRKLPVTEEMKKERAQEIVAQLINHAKWRSHGRSIKIEDLEQFLVIEHVDKDPKLADIVYRIQNVCTLLCDVSPIYKIFATEETKIFKQAAPAGIPLPFPKHPSPSDAAMVNFEQVCPKCGNIHKVYAKTKINPKLDEEAKNKGFLPFPKNGKLVCKCSQEIDFSGAKNHFEAQSGLKLII